jgi:hypothetical protein
VNDQGVSAFPATWRQEKNKYKPLEKPSSALQLHILSYSSMFSILRKSKYRALEIYFGESAWGVIVIMIEWSGVIVIMIGSDRGVIEEWSNPKESLLSVACNAQNVLLEWTPTSWNLKYRNKAPTYEEFCNFLVFQHLITWFQQLN